MQHVLVVDDDQEFRAAIADALGTVARVSDVATPVEAMWLMERTSVDFLICDLMLATTTSGAEILEAARTQWPTVRRILVTGFGDHLAGMKVPADTVLLKPVDLVALRELVVSS